MPLKRQSSNSSVGSLSRPHTIGSSTVVTKDKANKIMNRRKTRRDSLRESGQNKKASELDAILQSPTPYWKVAKERGISPPETRSTRKKKQGKRLNFSPPQDEDKENASNMNSKPAPKGDLLVFSPPDQAENARREKEEIEHKERSRQKRVRKARDSGQLLVFSPTFSNPAPLPQESSEKEDTSGDISEGEKSPARKRVATENPRKKRKKSAVSHGTASPSNMEVGFEPETDKSPVSATTNPSDTHNSEYITNELKSLRETLSRLVDSKESSSSFGYESELEKQKYEAQRVRAEALSAEKTQLEERLERFELQMKALESNSSSEREQLLVANAKLQAQLDVSSKDVESMAKSIQEIKERLESRCHELEQDKQQLYEQTIKLEADLAEARESLKESKKMLEAVKLQQTDETAMAEEMSSLTKTNSELNSELESIKVRNEELLSLVNDYEEKVHVLENSLLPESESQLQTALAELDRFKNEGDKASSQVKMYEETINTLRNDLEIVRQEREDERQNFQALNQDSSEAFEKMAIKLEERNMQITGLQNRIKELEASLEAEAQKFSAASEEAKNMIKGMGSRIKELEGSMESSILELKRAADEKRNFEEKLHNALEQLQQESELKQKFLAATQEKSLEIEEMRNKTDSMNRRINELEEELRLAKQERDNVRLKLETFDDREEDLFVKLRESHRVRRELHNRVMQLSGNIRVYVRVRPDLPGERKAAEEASQVNQGNAGKKRKHVEIEPEDLFHFPGMGSSEGKKSALGADDPTKNLLELTEPKKDRGGLSERRKKWKFGFDHVFNQNHAQEDIWDATEPLIQSAVDGFNVTLFAYGQTGSGKTFTMLGEKGNEGIISRSVRKLFDSKREIEELTRGDSEVELRVELLEVYNEQVRDLLVPNTGPDGKTLNLKVNANEVVGNVHLPVTSESEVSDILNIAQKRRCVKATASNAVSSRSHMIFTIHFIVNSKSGLSRSGRLNVCDLAGSERLSKSEANADVAGSLLKETKHINTSLSVLSNVIEKLQAGECNIPYRESKLTYLLQNSLGGNSKTLAIVCCSPLQVHFHETLCSLRFAAKVNKVDLKAKANFTC